MDLWSQLKLSVLVLPLLAAGCKVVDAPENLEDLMVFTFEHFEDDPEVMVDVLSELDPLVVELQEELAEGYRINNLTVEHLEAVGVEDPEVEHIIGATGTADYTHGLVDVITAITLPNKDEIYDSWEAYHILEETDRDCFLAQECETYSFTAEQTVKVVLLGDSTQTISHTYRWIFPEEGPFLVGRTLSPDPMEFSTAIVEIDQQYSIIVMYPLEGEARRVEAFWVESRVIGLDVPDSFAVDNFAKAVANQCERIDEYIDESR